TNRSPFSETATTLGSISALLSLGTTRAILLRTYATHVLVVPRSMPSRMGFSGMSVGAWRVDRCYGASPWPCKKTHRTSEAYHCTTERPVAPPAVDATRSADPAAPP